MNTKKNGYNLSRRWFDFAFENPEKVKPNHAALYFFCVEHCNRLGWKEKFGLPTESAKEAIGIRSYNTYIKTLNDLVEFGFIKIIEKSKNQYSSNIVALSNFDKAHDKALDKALIKHVTKHRESTRQSIDSIIKQLNKEQLTREQVHSLAQIIEKYNEIDTQELDPRFIKYNEWLKSKAPYCSNPENMEQLSEEQFLELIKKYRPEQIRDIVERIENRKDKRTQYANLHTAINIWLDYDKGSGQPEARRPMHKF